MAFIVWLLDATRDAVSVYIIEATDALSAIRVAEDIADAESVAYSWITTEAATAADLDGTVRSGQLHIHVDDLPDWDEDAFDEAYNAWYEAGMPR